MGYRDDFYIASNIIGYTGTLHATPSVYFRDGTEFGHITQAHGFGGNIGREKVRNNATYEICNQIDPVTKAMVCVEKENGTVVHTSRNLFQPITGEDDAAIAARAITAFPDLKTRYNVENAAFLQRNGVWPNSQVVPHDRIVIGGHRQAQ